MPPSDTHTSIGQASRPCIGTYLSLRVSQHSSLHRVPHNITPIAAKTTNQKKIHQNHTKQRLKQPHLYEPSESSRRLALRAACYLALHIHEAMPCSGRATQAMHRPVTAGAFGASSLMPVPSNASAAGSLETAVCSSSHWSQAGSPAKCS